MHRVCGSAVVACTLGLGLGLRAENWPQWRGPFHNGSTTETGLPASLVPDGNRRWVTPLPGPGAASPVVWGNRVFVSTVARASGEVVALGLDARDGRILWQDALAQDCKAMGGNNMAAPSPVTDGEVVCFLCGTGELVAFDLDGNRLWTRSLATDLGGFVIKYGYSSSPLLHQGRVYVALLQNANPAKYHPSTRQGALDSFLLAIDVRTGRDLWRHVRGTDATDESAEAYVTPVPFEAQGRAELVIAGGEYVTGHNPQTGEELWRWGFSPADGKIWQRVVASPVPGDGLIYAFRPKMRPTFALRAGGQGRLTDEWVAWRHESVTTDVATPLLYRDHLYVLNGDKRMLHCLDPKTGTVVWDGALAGTSVFRASPVGADGRIYCFSEAGEVVVVAAEDPFRIVSRTALGDGPCRASVAAANGALFVRTTTRLSCFAETGIAPTPAAASEAPGQGGPK